MRLFGASRHPRQPPFGARVNWGHPLSAGLTSATVLNSANTAASVNLVDSVPWPLNDVAKAPTPKARSAGLGHDFTLQGAYYDLSPLQTRFQVQKASLFWYGIPLNAAVAHVSAIVTVYSSGTPGDCYTIARDPTVLTTLTVAWNNGTGVGGEQSLNITNAWTLDTPTTVGMTIDGTTVTAYTNGVNVGSTTTGVGTITYASNLVGLGPAAGNNNTQCFTSCAYSWARALTGGEMAWLDKDPFAPIKPAGALMPPVLTYGSMAGMQSSMVVPIMTVQQW